MAEVADAQDRAFIKEFWEGMPILGPINRSGRWPAISEPAVTSIEDVESRAWEIRQSVIERAMNDQLAKGD